MFWLHGSSAIGASKHTLSLDGDIVAGVIAIAIANALAKRSDVRRRSWHEQRKRSKGKAEKDEGTWQLRLLGRGSMKVTFAVGAVLSFSGVSYLNALGHIVAFDPGYVPTVLLVVYFCVITVS